MSNDRKPDAPKTIAVRHLKFFRAHPSLNASESITSDTSSPNRSHYVIEYVPSLRHHRVEFRPIDAKPRVLFIHETHVASWEPAL